MLNIPKFTLYVRKRGSNKEGEELKGFSVTINKYAFENFLSIKTQISTILKHFMNRQRLDFYSTVKLSVG